MGLQPAEAVNTNRMRFHLNGCRRGLQFDSGAAGGVLNPFVGLWPNRSGHQVKFSGTSAVLVSKSCSTNRSYRPSCWTKQFLYDLIEI